jgi:hypothetical protein
MVLHLLLSLLSLHHFYGFTLTREQCILTLFIFASCFIYSCWEKTTGGRGTTVWSQCCPEQWNCKFFWWLVMPYFLFLLVSCLIWLLWPPASKCCHLYPMQHCSCYFPFWLICYVPLFFQKKNNKNRNSRKHTRVLYILVLLSELWFS